MKAVAVLVARIFATSVANGLVFVSPCGQSGVDVVFVEWINAPLATPASMMGLIVVC